MVTTADSVERSQRVTLSADLEWGVVGGPAPIRSGRCGWRGRTEQFFKVKSTPLHFICGGSGLQLPVV